MQKLYIRYLLFFLPILFAIACTSVNLKQEKGYIIENARQVKVYVYPRLMDKKNARVVTFGKEKVLPILGYISNEKADLMKCGYNGEIAFIKKGGNGEKKQSILEENMKYNTKCGHIVFYMNGKLYSQKLTQEGLRFLSSLRQNQKK